MGAYHSAGVCSGNTIYQCTPDVEVLASASHRVSVTSIAEMSTCSDVVSVEEGETHKLIYRTMIINRVFRWMRQSKFELTPGELLAASIGPNTNWYPSGVSGSAKDLSAQPELSVI